MLRFRVPGTLLMTAMAFVTIAGPLLAQVPDSRPELRGTWIHEGALTSPSSIDALFRRLAENGYNVAYIRTWYQGATVYPSDVVAAAGGPRQHSQFATSGRDPLAEAVAAGQRHGVEVAAWMEYGLVSHTGYARGMDCQSPGAILLANPEWAMVDRQGRVAVPPQENGLCFYWMDPGHPEVIDFMASMAAEIAARYPEMGIYEADRFRYPSTSFSYSPVAITRYMAETGNADPLTYAAGDPQQSAWYNWRREQINRMTKAVYDTVKSVNPRMIVSAAVVPPYMLTGGDDKMQNWPAWAHGGYMDMLEVMLYLPDSHLPIQLSQARSRVPSDFLLAAGIGIGESQLQNFNLNVQIAESRRQNTAGIVTWCWDRCALADELSGPGMQHFGDPALAPFNDRQVLVDGAGFTRTGAWTAVDANGRRDYILAAGVVGQAEWRTRLLRDGYYDVYVRFNSTELASAEANFTVVDESRTLSMTVDQRLGSGWRRIGTDYFGRGEVIVRLGSAADGAVIAGDVRLVRVDLLAASEVLSIGDGRLEVRFSQPVDVSSVTPAAFRIDGGAVLAAGVADDNRVAEIQVAGLEDGREYELVMEGLRDGEGRPAPVSRLTFIYVSEGLHLQVAPGDGGFSTSGTWATVADSDAPGGSYRTTSSRTSTTRASWFSVVPEAGLYEIKVWIPANPAGGRAAYVIGHSASPADQGRFDTLFVRQDVNESTWVSLGAYNYFQGATSLVTLRSNLSDGTVAAGAVRWLRTLRAVDTEGETLPVTALAVSQPYPNPGSSWTALDIDMPRPSHLSVEIYDLLGRRVLTLPTSLFNAGRSRLDIDVSGLASGHYFVRILMTEGQPAGAVTVVRRITVVQ